MAKNVKNRLQGGTVLGGPFHDGHTCELPTIITNTEKLKIKGDDNGSRTAILDPE